MSHAAAANNYAAVPGTVLPRRTGPCPNRWLSRVSIRVAHSCPLVAAGLVATLQQVSDYDVAIAEPPTRAWLRPPGVCVFVADHKRAAELLDGAQRQPDFSRPLRPRVVLLAAGEQEALRNDAFGRRVDACLPLDCPTADLLAAVRTIGRDALGPSVDSADEMAIGPRARGSLSPGILRRVRAYIEEHLAEGIHLHTLAALAGISVCHFSRAFRQSLGMPPHHYLITRRVAIAVALIRETDRPLSAISLEAGFADQSHFSRTFMHMTGETPGEFRHRCH